MFSKMPRARNLFFPFACNWVGQIPFTCKVPTSSNLRSRVWTHFHLLTIVGGMGWLIWCRTCWAPGSSPDIRRARGSNKPNRPTRQQSQPCTSSRNGSSRRRTAEEYIALVFFLLIFVKWEYQCLRLEGEVDWVASGPWRENDIELQSNWFPRIDFGVTSVHWFYRCLAVAGLSIL